MYINKSIIVGNITKDPELKSLPSGQKLCSFSVATNRTWKDVNGEKQEAVDYHNIVCFGKQAEIIAQWMKKGSQIYVDGRLTTRSWDDKDTGKKAFRTEIIAENVQFGAKRDNTPKSTNEERTIDYSEPQEDKKVETTSDFDYGEAIDPNDIPF